MIRTRAAAFILMFAPLAGHAIPDIQVEVYKSTTFVSCDAPQAKPSLAEHKAELVAAGIPVSEERTGSLPGMVLPRDCGRTISGANVFQIPSTHEATALGLGFKRAADAQQESGIKPALVEVFKPTGGRQCSDDGVKQEQHRLELEKAGVTPTAMRAGQLPGFGNVPQRCGSPKHTANYFTIPLRDLGKAEAAGFHDARKPFNPLKPTSSKPSVEQHLAQLEARIAALESKPTPSPFRKLDTLAEWHPGSEDLGRVECESSELGTIVTTTMPVGAPSAGEGTIWACLREQRGRSLPRFMWRRLATQL